MKPSVVTRTFFCLCAQGNFETDVLYIGIYVLVYYVYIYNHPIYKYVSLCRIYG